jgi:hypothetical protein
MPRLSFEGWVPFGDVRRQKLRRVPALMEPSAHFSYLFGGLETPVSYLNTKSTVEILQKLASDSSILFYFAGDDERESFFADFPGTPEESVT